MNLNNNLLLSFLQFSECDNIGMDSIMGVIETVLESQDLEQVRSDTPVRILGYFEIIIPKYSFDDFFKHFRMSRSTFQKLHVILRERLGKNSGKIPIEKKILFTLWFLAKEECFMSTSDRFGIALSTAHLIFVQIIKEISNLKSTFIQFPTASKQLEISNEFKAQSGIPGVVGAIDGSHIQIKQPTGNAVDFYNRKSFHSIILQAVCDNNRKFIDIYVRSPGKMHDARIFKKSPIYAKLIDTNEPLLDETRHILGDTAYPNTNYLVTPFRQNGHLTTQQDIFNVKLIAMRSCIERAFALLKGKFRKLKYLDMSSHQRINETITAACVLHNFILDNDIFPGDEFIEYDVDSDPDEQVELGNFDIATSNNKRNHLLSLIT